MFKHPIILLVSSVCAGFIIAICTIFLFESWSSHYYPMDTQNPSHADYVKALKQLPINAFLIVLLGYWVSSFLGGYVAARIAPRPKKILAALAVGFILLLSGIFIFITLPHPWWMVTSSCIGYMAASYGGAKIAAA